MTHFITGPRGLAAALLAATVEGGGYGWALAKMLLALLAVCAIAFLALRFALRRLAGTTGARSPAGTMEVVDRCPLEGQSALWLVRVGERYLLLGSGGGTLAKVAELDRRPQRAAASPTPRFVDILRGRAGRRDGPGRGGS